MEPALGHEQHNISVAEKCKHIMFKFQIQKNQIFKISNT